MSLPIRKLADRLRDEEDLCRNETATDIADLLGEARRELQRLELGLDLCRAGRFHEWEDFCALTKVLSEVAQGLKDSSDRNEQCRRAYRKLNAITTHLWMIPAEKCAAKMPATLGDAI